MIFDTIPNTKVPGQRAELVTGKGSVGLSSLDYKCLLIGQALSTGTAAANVLLPISSSDQAGVLFGKGSHLHLMAKAYFRNNRVNSLTAIAVQKDVVATATGKSVGSIQILTAATADGELILYIGGQRVVTTVTALDAVGTIAAAIVAEITANHPDLPVVATVSTDTVTFTAKCVGISGDEIPIVLNYAPGELSPAGVTATITAMASGASNPALTTTIAALGDNWFQLLTTPYTDTTSLSAIEIEMDRRFSPMAQIDGLHFTTKWAGYSDALAFGATRNSLESCIPSAYGYQSTPWEMSAMVMGQVAAALAAGNGAEARPFTGLPLVGLLAPLPENRLTYLEKQSLLSNGISTLQVDAGGIVRIERLITTYQKNASGAVDDSWFDINVRFIAMFIRYDWVNYLGRKYQRFKMANDGVRVGSGQPVLTPKGAKSEAVSRFSTWEEAGLVEDFETFVKEVIASRNVTNVNAMDWFLPLDFVNQFLIGNTQINVKP